jgi:DNA-binding LacI/PurR family transcriptional regulator
MVDWRNALEGRAIGISSVGTYRAIKERGRRIQEDLAVVGCDHSAFAPVMEPPLTSVRKPRTRMGQAAASMMLGLIDPESDPAPTLGSLSGHRE